MIKHNRRELFGLIGGALVLPAFAVTDPVNIPDADYLVELLLWYPKVHEMKFEKDRIVITWETTDEFRKQPGCAGFQGLYESYHAPTPTKKPIKYSPRGYRGSLRLRGSWDKTRAVTTEEVYLDPGED